MGFSFKPATGFGERNTASSRAELGRFGFSAEPFRGAREQAMRPPKIAPFSLQIKHLCRRRGSLTH
jgi:hypothetical protein